ncbi:hypothetical protein BKA70DRAFT_1332784 [Coprinopsis sp. MPI-PUGE-AT-0042]|nr:hypothetical protein BKA70DRAFT_1332784 [Coprinopsis sp. MPI-PUGE-AT-0042]
MVRCKQISCLPPEILLHIFTLALLPLINRAGRLRFQAIRCVCSEWRSISFSSPILWSSLDASNHRKKHFPSLAIAIEKWVSRTGPSMPFEFRFAHTAQDDMSDEDTTALRDLVVRHQSQWKYLAISGAGRCLWDIFQTSTPTGWLNLQHLSVFTFRLFDGGMGRGVQVLQNIPSIQTTRLQDLNLHILDQAITTADIHFLSSYTYLRTLDLYIQKDALQPVELAGVVTSLPHLEDLHFAAGDLALLQYLDTPAIYELAVSLEANRAAQDDILRNFLARCTRLHSISLLVRPIHTAWMLPTLSGRPNIRTVTIGSWPELPYGDALPGENAAWWDSWCPNLEELTFVVVSDGSIPEDELQMKHLTSLASFLRRRSDLGQRKLNRLVFRNTPGACNFPYGMFETLDIGKVTVMVPM